MRRVWRNFRDAVVETAKSLPFNQKLIFSGALVGLAAGLGAWLLETLIRLFESVGIDRLSQLPSALRIAATLFLPALGALAAGWLVHFLVPEAKGLGLYEVIQAIRERKGQIEPNVVWGKALASAAVIGSGGSAGQEGPVIHIGAAAGSWIGQKLRLSQEDWRTFAAGGAVGGLSAAFGIPQAGVFFTMEVILKDFANEAFPAVVIASVTGTFTARALLGHGAFFPPLGPHSVGALEFVRFGVLGLACAFMGRLYRGGLKLSESLFHGLRRLPDWVRPAIGGLGVGALALAWPEVMGMGHGTIDLALSAQMSGRYAAALAGAKLLATSLTLGSGAPGGSLMPALFVGAMTGHACAAGLARIPLFPPPSGALAGIGMACLFAAAFEAPVTAIVMALELTQDYGLLLPAMFACTVAYVFSRKAQSPKTAPEAVHAEAL
jgi:CIC family chloride channel protein